MHETCTLDLVLLVKQLLVFVSIQQQEVYKQEDRTYFFWFIRRKIHESGATRLWISKLLYSTSSKITFVVSTNTKLSQYRYGLLLLLEESEVRNRNDFLSLFYVVVVSSSIPWTYSERNGIKSSAYTNTMRYGWIKYGSVEGRSSTYLVFNGSLLHNMNCLCVDCISFLHITI